VRAPAADAADADAEGSLSPSPAKRRARAHDPQEDETLYLQLKEVLIKLTEGRCVRVDRGPLLPSLLTSANLSLGLLHVANAALEDDAVAKEEAKLRAEFAEGLVGSSSSSSSSNRNGNGAVCETVEEELEALKWRWQVRVIACRPLSSSLPATPPPHSRAPRFWFARWQRAVDILMRQEMDLRESLLQRGFNPPRCAGASPLVHTPRQTHQRLRSPPSLYVLSLSELAVGAEHGHTDLNDGSVDGVASPATATENASKPQPPPPQNGAKRAKVRGPSLLHLSRPLSKLLSRPLSKLLSNHFVMLRAKVRGPASRPPPTSHYPSSYTHLTHLSACGTHSTHTPRHTFTNISTRIVAPPLLLLLSFHARCRTWRRPYLGPI